MIDVANGGNLVSSKYQFTFFYIVCVSQERLLCQSISSGAQYVAHPKQNWMKKSENMLLWLSKMGLGPPSEKTKLDEEK
jgi:hypothetical protein